MRMSRQLFVGSILVPRAAILLASATDRELSLVLTGEKCLRRRRARNHVVGLRECYWFLGGSRWENALEKKGKMAAVWELTDLWFSYLFERSRLLLWPISSGPYSMENITLGHRLASRFQPVVGYKWTSWHDVFARKGCEKGELFLRCLIVTVSCHVVQKDIIKERKNDSWALCRCIN